MKSTTHSCGENSCRGVERLRSDARMPAKATALFTENSRLWKKTSASQIPPVVLFQAPGLLTLLFLDFEETVTGAETSVIGSGDLSRRGNSPSPSRESTHQIPIFSAAVRIRSGGNPLEGAQLGYLAQG